LLGRLILLGALVAGALWFLHWFRTTPPQRVAKQLRRGALYGGIGLVLVLALTGRLNPIFAALAAAVPVVLRAVNLLRVLPAIQQVLRSLGVGGGLTGAAAGSAGAGPAGGRTSSIRTRLLEMTLDHSSGDMDGLVLEGPYQGRRLSDLALDQVLDLLGRCRREDAQSAAVLEAYLDRTHEDWRERGEPSGPGGAAAAAGGPMSREEAYAVLGLAAGAGEAEIRDAHRRLMQKLHPDRGGSDYLAAKINEAKRLLLED
jgi:hypothetical protein